MKDQDLGLHHVRTRISDHPFRSRPTCVTFLYTVLSPDVSAADTLLYAVTLTADHEHLQCIACDVMKLYTKFERKRAMAVELWNYSDFNT